MLANIRYAVTLLMLSTAVFAAERRERVGGASSRGSSPAVEASNVILVVSDGLRWQEVFRGADSLLLFGKAAGRNAADVQRRFWRATAAERRHALMPFVWNTLATRGLLLGNRDVNSRARVTNEKNFSYPGYNEMLVGYPDARIDRNDYGPNPNVTVFEWLDGRTDFRGRVGAIAAWDTFVDIFNAERSDFPIRASKEEPLDARAHRDAMDFLTQQHPRALFVGYVETDDLAHHGEYGLTLNAAHAVDAYLAALWSAVEADARYRGNTTLIFTTDHGRGRTPRDWRDHGAKVNGSDEIWVAMMGPDVAATGEARNGPLVTESQIAATVAAALGLDYHAAVPRAARPVRAFVSR